MLHLLRKYHPPDIKPMPGFGLTLDIEIGQIRKWFIDKYGQKRWHSNNELVNTYIDS